MPKPHIGNEAVKGKTGKSWDDWFALKDANGCMEVNYLELISDLI